MFRLVISIIYIPNKTLKWMATVAKSCKNIFQDFFMITLKHKRCCGSICSCYLKYLFTKHCLHVSPPQVQHWASEHGHNTSQGQGNLTNRLVTRAALVSLITPVWHVPGLLTLRSKSTAGHSSMQENTLGWAQPVKMKSRSAWQLIRWLVKTTAVPPINRPRTNTRSFRI